MNDRYVLVLGSGASINSLTSEEREILNSFPVKISINKYAAFFEKARIVPTHIYFTDDYYISSVRFFRYLMHFLRTKKLSGLTLIVSSRAEKYLKNKCNRWLCFYFRLVNFFINIRILYVYLASRYRPLKRVLSQIGFRPKNNYHKYTCIPDNCTIHPVTIVTHLKRGTPWAESLNQPLYHYKGSFSSVLNYISIFFPNRIVVLAGVDFNSPDYFFEKELNALSFNIKDWTSELINKEKKHYSIIETKGKTIDDELPFMLEQLKKRNIVLFSLNKDSYLIEKGFVKHINLNEVMDQGYKI